MTAPMSRIRADSTVRHPVPRWCTALSVCSVVLLLVAAMMVTPAGAQGEDDGRLSALTLNTGGFGSDQGVPWEARAGRVAAWAQRNNVVPDIIALQEVFGWLYTPPLRSCGRGFAVGAGDYDQIDVLLKSLRDTIGVTYRVAYLTGKQGDYGDIRCTLYGAQAVLYNPARLVNLTAQASARTTAHDAVNNLHGIPHLRRSLPLCNRGTQFMALDALIDGPPQNDKCDRPTPSGPAWAVFREQGHIAASFVRLAFAKDPSRWIDVFNVHPTSGQESFERPVILRLIAEVEPPPYAGSAHYYPPLLLGDFNGLPIESHFPGFVTVYEPPRHPDPAANDPVAIGIGTANSVPAQYRARAVRKAVVPDLPAGVFCQGPPDLLVSDHCGVFVEFGLDGPDAGALRGVFVDAPRRVDAMSSYRLTAVPAGGSPNLRFHWQPGGGTSAVLDARAGSPRTAQTWTVEVTDSASGRTVRETVTVAAEDTACLQACQEARDECMECRGADCPLPRECATWYGRCVARCQAGDIVAKSDRIAVRGSGAMEGAMTLPLGTAGAVTTERGCADLGGAEQFPRLRRQTLR